MSEGAPSFSTCYSIVNAPKVTNPSLFSFFFFFRDFCLISTGQGTKLEDSYHNSSQSPRGRIEAENLIFSSDRRPNSKPMIHQTRLLPATPQTSYAAKTAMHCGNTRTARDFPPPVRLIPARSLKYVPYSSSEDSS